MAQYSLIVQVCGLKHQLFHSISVQDSFYLVYNDVTVVSSYVMIVYLLRDYKFVKFTEGATGVQW